MPLLWVSCAFIFGLLAGKWLTPDWPLLVILAILFLSLVFLDPLLCKQNRFWAKMRSWIPVSAGVLLLFMVLGSLRFWTTSLPIWQEDDLAWYNDQGEYQLTGWISAAPDRRENMTVYQMDFIEIEDANNPDWTHPATKINGRARVYMYVSAPWVYGDLLQFTGEVVQPAEDRDFSYRDYLASFDIFTVIYHPRHVLQVGSGYGSEFNRGLIKLRESARKTIFAIFPQPESGLLTGILLGVDNDLPKSLAQSYRDTGISHIIAISGFNMAVLAGLFLWFFSTRFGPYWAALIAGVLLIIYTLFIESSAAVVRALIMAVMGMGGHLIGRRQVGINALFSTAAVMCLVNPLLLQDVSFHLSFFATFGLVVFAEPMQNWLKSWLEKRFSEKISSKFTGPLSEFFLFTLAAQFATLPVIAYHFGRISISSLLANPLILPVQPAVLVLGGLTTLAGILHPLAGKVLMFFSWPLLKYNNFMVDLLAKIKGGVLTIHPASSLWILIFFLVFLLVFALRNYFKKLFQSGSFIWVILGLGCAIFTVWSIYLHRPDGLLHFKLLRCADEVTIMVQTPNGKTLIINPGGDMNELTANLEKSLSPWDFRVDAVLLTNREVAGEVTSLADRIPVTQSYLAPTTYRLENNERSITIPDQIEIAKLLPGQTWTIEPGVGISLLSENLEETALLLEYGYFRVLIPNGVDYAAIKSDAPDSVKGLTAIVLGSKDVDYIPPRVWTGLEPQAILWKDVSISPFVGSFGMDSHAEVSLVSDGTESWLNP